jgi:hypothetical protein
MRIYKYKLVFDIEVDAKNKKEAEDKAMDWKDPHWATGWKLCFIESRRMKAQQGKELRYEIR